MGLEVCHLATFLRVLIFIARGEQRERLACMEIAALHCSSPRALAIQDWLARIHVAERHNISVRPP